ncbi:SH3 domain-containing protein [Leptospira sp. 201903070]|uniref:SH3 domain-containing protein n=1 Tax=Leptospira ainlahdjerensis TaxID=2810033 RepID=A0ABS2UCZ7_9LEPT|nr:SH3 domain-containing protein [Leptospira ainlahdjerensis]MBM9578250.1 SH3 domain-containing protein [Leptospira ainlahdjerensis]
MHKSRFPFLIRLSINLALLLFLHSCASVPIGFGIVLQKDIKVYAKPTLKSEIAFSLDQSSPYDVLAADLPDKDSASKLLWFKIRQKDEEGFISKEEEILKNNVLNFLPVIGDKFGLVTATQLLLRETPGTRGKILGRLATRNIVELVEEHSKKINIDGMQGTWAKIKTKDGKIGFVFTAYLMRGISPEVLSKTDTIELRQTGWALLTKNPTKVFKYTNGKLISNSDLPYEFTKGAELYFTQKLITPQGKVYFYISGEKRPNYDSDEPEQDRVVYSGYLPAENLKNYPTHSKLYLDNNTLSSDRALLEEIDKALSGDADLSTVTESEHSFGRKKVYHVEVQAKSTYVDDTNSYKRNLLILKEGKSYTNLQIGIGDIQFEDLDGDGIDEVMLTETSGRSGDISQVLYRFNGSKFETLLNFSGFDGECGHITYSSSSISLNSKNCSKESKERIKVFEYVLKKGKLVPLR